MINQGVSFDGTTICEVLRHRFVLNFFVKYWICGRGVIHVRASEAWRIIDNKTLCMYSNVMAISDSISLKELPVSKYTGIQCIQEILSTCTRLLQGCTKRKALAEGKLIHAHITNSGIEPDVLLGTTLINMYTRCGSLEAARQVFDKLLEPDLLAWNMMIVAYAKGDPTEEAFRLFNQMEKRGVEPNEVTFVGILTASAKLLDLEKGKQIHAHIIKIEIKPNVFMSNALIDMYVKCGSIHDACQVFDTMSEWDVVSWNTMIGGWTKHACAGKAFSFFRKMVLEGLKPNQITFLSLMNACAILRDLKLGKQLHSQLSKYGIVLSQSVKNTLIDMYCKCGSIKDALESFDTIVVKDEISWNAIIGGHARNGHADEVLIIFRQMTEEGLNPNEITFLSVLQACANLGNLKQAKQVHACFNRTWVESNVVICSALVDMYAKCGELEDAKELFYRASKQNVVLWTVMIAGYIKHGHAEEALRLFCQMELKGVSPNEITFVSILDACISLGSLEKGQIVHARILEKRFQSNIPLENALVNMYAKCGCIDDACRVFDNMDQRDHVSWTAIIAGYAALELCEKAFWVFEKMIQEDVKPDAVTFVIVNNACANIAALEQGRLIHTYIMKSGIVVDAFVGNALIDMYAKCGTLKEAQCVLERLSNRDIVSWNTMVSGCAQHGQGKDLLLLVNCMEEEGVRLNHITVLCILSACGRSGLVDEGFFFFDYMLREHIVTPMVEHYACMVDLLGRAGYLNEAVCFIQRMPFQPSATVWGALLGACKLHGLVDLAEYAAEQILQLEPENVAVFIVLSNIYSAV